MKYKFILTTIISFTLLAMVAIPAFADNNSTDFESFSLGNVNGQDGWMKTGPYDVEVVPNTFGHSSFETQSLRISNGVATGAFGDQTFAKPLVDSVGEVDSTAGSFAVGTMQSHFEMQFDFATTTVDQQPGLVISISPDRGDGSRMSYLSLTDTPTGIDVTFYDVQGTSNPANFVPTIVATGLNRNTPHTAKLEIDLVDGPSNDVVKVYIDGALVHTGTSWENYYRYDSEASAEQSPRIIKTAIFRAGGTSVPANMGNGYIIDNVSLMSGMPEEPFVRSAEILNPTAGQKVSGNVSFEAVLHDKDKDDSVQWAVRAGTCAAGTGTVFGNVDGFNNPFTWDGETFNAVTDTSTWTPGSYCFVFNPTESQGDDPIRLTREFIVKAVRPHDKDECKKDGWKDFDGRYKNQGQCVSDYEHEREHEKEKKKEKREDREEKEHEREKEKDKDKDRDKNRRR